MAESQGRRNDLRLEPCAPFQSHCSRSREVCSHQEPGSEEGDSSYRNAIAPGLYQHLLGGDVKTSLVCRRSNKKSMWSRPKSDKCLAAQTEYIRKRHQMTSKKEPTGTSRGLTTEQNKELTPESLNDNSAQRNYDR